MFERILAIQHLLKVVRFGAQISVLKSENVIAQTDAFHGVADVGASKRRKKERPFLIKYSF